MPDAATGEELQLPHESDHEAEVRQEFGRLLQSAPFEPEEQVDDLALFLRRQPLADLLSIDALYRMVLDVPGSIMEFGVHRGRHMALLTALRGVYEPYNPHRRIVGFDTFQGFPDVANIDELGHSATRGKFSLPSGYAGYLREILDAHESTEPLHHIRRTLLVQGDVRETLPAYLHANPQTIIALAYFDLDLYEPTLTALRAIRPYLACGSVIAFDELNHAKWPGETAALREAWDLDAVRLRLFPGRATPAFVRWPVLNTVTR
jgi:hypothetical protein